MYIITAIDTGPLQIRGKFAINSTLWVRLGWRLIIAQLLTHKKSLQEAANMQETPPRYHNLLLTMWEERDQEPNSPVVWRFRLEDPRTGQTQGFTNLESLMEVLKQKMGKA